MRLVISLLAIALMAVASAATAQQPAGTPLVCSGATTEASCGVYHFHVQLWRPDTKGFTQELTGINSFASMTACENARADASKANLGVIEFLRRTEPNGPFQPNRLGPCHCDMTIVKGAPNYLDDAQRAAQLRMEQEVVGKMKEKLLDSKATPDSDIIRLAAWRPHPNGGVWSKALTMNDATLQGAPPPPLREEQLKDTSASTEITRTTVGAPALPLADVPAPTGAPRIAANPTGTIDIRLSKDRPEATTPTAVPAGEPAGTAQDVVASSPEDDDVLSRFITFEMARAQAVINASNGLSDQALRGRIFDAANERVQLLTNVRSLVEGAGAKSRLAAAIRKTTDEAGRLAFAAKIFGPSMSTHWVPKDARDIIVDVPPAIQDDPTAVLRDSTGRFTDEQKKIALYVLLGRSTSLTPTQELWLTGILESSLQE